MCLSFEGENTRVEIVVVAMTKEVLIPWRREVREGFREIPLIEKAGTERTKTSP